MTSSCRSVEADSEVQNLGIGRADLDHPLLPFQTPGNDPGGQIPPDELQVQAPFEFQSSNDHLDGFFQSHPLPTGGNYAVSPVCFCRGTSTATAQRINEGNPSVLQLGFYKTPPTTSEMSYPHTTSLHHVCPEAGSGYSTGTSLYTTPPEGLVSTQRQSCWRNNASQQKPDSM